MSRAETIEAVLSLLPGRPGSDSKQARQRLQQLSSGELRRMFEHLASLPESRPLTNTRRRQWEKAYASASSLSTLEPLLADWQQINQRSALWMGELAAQQGMGAASASAPAEAAVAEEPLQALARSVSGHEGAEPLDLARATLDPRFDESDEMAVLAMAVSDRFTQVGFAARLQAFTAYREAAVAANRNGKGADLRQYDIDLSHILPWDWLLARLIALRMHFEGEGAGLPQRDRLCILRLLTVLRRETWPDALESDSGPDLDENRVFIALVNTLWAYPASFVPSVVVGSLIRLLDAGVKTLRSSHGIEMERKQYRLASLSIIRALFLLYWFREESGDFSVANRVRNLAPAFNAAENAGFLFNNTALVERRMLDALRSSTANIPPLPDTYLSLVGESRVEEVGEFKLLKDAGDVMRLQAHVSLLTSHDLVHAKELLLVAEAYYRHAQVFANDERYLYQRIVGTARIRLLQWTVARKAGRPEEAANLMQQALVEIDRSGVPQVGALLYLKCKVMINQARSSPTSAPDDAIIVTINELITDGANRSGGWNLLREYYLAVKKTPEMALHVVSEWSNRAPRKIFA